MARTKTEVREKLRELHAQVESGVRPRRHYTVNDALDDWLTSRHTINKWAQGISGTYALGVLAETTSLGVPTVVLPFVNTALASRIPFRRSVDSLRTEGVRILLGPGGIEPHRPVPAATWPARTPGI
jgi:hypothetical protein